MNIKILTSVCLEVEIEEQVLPNSVIRDFSTTKNNETSESDKEMSEDEFEGFTTQCVMDKPDYREEPLSFLTLFRHWSVATKQEEDGLTLFLKLMHHYKPQIDYSVLPGTGKQLLRIDGRDFPYCGKCPSFYDEKDDGNGDLSNLPDHQEDSDVSSDSDTSFQSERWNGVSSSEENGSSDESSDDTNPTPSGFGREPESQRGKKWSYALPPAVVLPNDGGKLMYFGLECALSGDSPGTMFRHADLFQYISIYYEDADVLPQCIRTKV